MELVVLISAGLSAGAALAFVFGDAPHVLRRLLGLGVMGALVAGWVFYELAAGPDLHGPGAPLEGIVAVSTVGALIFFFAWAAGAVSALGSRSLAGRRRTSAAIVRHRS